MSDLANLSLVSDSETETREPSCKKQAKSDSPADAKRRKILDDRLHLRQSNNEVENSTEKTKMQKQSTESAGQSSEEIQILEKVEDTALNINALPPEILVKILSYIRQEELLKFARVCKRWYELTRNAALWKKVNISFRHLPLKDNEFIVGFLNLLPSSVIRVELVFNGALLSGLYKFDLAEFARGNQKRYTNLQTLIVHSIEIFASFGFILHLCAQFIPNLCVLVFYDSFVICQDEEIFESVAKIEILHFSNCSDLFLNPSIYSKMPHLKELCLFRTTLHDTEVKRHAVINSKPFRKKWSKNRVDFFNNLKMLDVGFSFGIDSVTFCKIRNHGLNINELYLCGAKLYDEDLNFKSKNNKFPQLKLICVNCSYLTWRGIFCLIQSCPSLDYIYVRMMLAEDPFVLIPYKPQIVKTDDAQCNLHYKKRKYLTS